MAEDTAEDRLQRSLGDMPPILADGRRPPDRREISLRWLSGTFLTALTGSILMGVALFAAVDGRQQLAIPAEAAAMARPGQDRQMPGTRLDQKGNRLIPTEIAAKPSDKQILSIPIVMNDGEKEVIRKQPFARVKMALAANYSTDVDYPRFDPLDIMRSDDSATTAAPAPVLYGSDVESEVSLKSKEFPADQSPWPMAPSMSIDEVEENVRTNGSVLTDGDKVVPVMTYVDPQRFAGPDSTGLDMLTGITARVVEENTTVSAPQPITKDTPEYAEDILPVSREQTIAQALEASGYARDRSEGVDAALSVAAGIKALAPGELLRVGIVQRNERADIVRVSLYRDAAHIATVAADDHGSFVAGEAPPMLDAIASAFEDGNSAPIVSSRDLPRVYDGLYRAALSYGMGDRMASQLVRLLAPSVDFQSRLKPADQLEAFYTVADENGEVTDESELLYVKAKFGDNVVTLYRFQDPADMSVDYYDPKGKTNRQFLIRNPCPTGIFKSGFGMRRHPILGYMRMHTGVDWAAPRGTPIIAAGNGTVISAGWDRGGYGNQTLIQHANGYVTSYNHQSAIAKGIKPGASVRQGQIIGWVGTTGLSTGPHLHYELIVNGNRVDPLRVRLPGGKTLKGDLLAKFEDERKRIDTLLGNDRDQNVVASN